MPLKAILTVSLALALPLLFSCKAPRDGTTVVEGQVVDRQTGAAVADATVSVMKSKTQSNNATYSHVRDIEAGSDGRFSFSFEGDGDYSYILMATTPLGHYTWWQEAPNITSGRKNKDVKVKAQAPAWVRVQLVDEPPTNFVYFSIYGFKDDFYGPLHLFSDTTFIKRVDGGVNTTIIYAVNTVFAASPIFQKNVNPEALDTINLQIKY